MRKQIFGYNKREIDRLIDSLQSQNDLLLQKLADMTVKVNSPIEEIPEVDAVHDYQAENLQLSERIAALEAIIKNNKEENESLKSNPKTLPQQLHSVNDGGQKSSPSSLEDGRLKDMKTLLQNMNDFISKIEMSRIHVENIMEDFQKKYSSSLKQITDIIEDVYEGLQVLEISSEKLDILFQIDSISNQIKSSIDTLPASKDQAESEKVGKAHT